MLIINEDTIKIKQATKKGYAEIAIGNGISVADLSYPKSKTRRGRVEKNGQCSPTITTTGGLYVIEEVEDG